MQKVWIGIDNGSTGTFAILSDFKAPLMMKNPVMKIQDYCKKKKNISRLDHRRLREIITDYVEDRPAEIYTGIERAMVNPRTFMASESGLRFLEATWLVMEDIGSSVTFLASTDWQRKFLPKGTKGNAALKKASLDIGNRLYPQFRDFKHPDRDGLLIAHYMKLSNL